MVNRKQFKVQPVEYGPITPRGQGSRFKVAPRNPLAGFTIVELLVSILLTSIIMTAVYSVYRVQTHSAKVQENRLEAQEYARSVLDMMVREIRNAGYAPTGATCAGIAVANAQTLQFSYDANANGVCTDADEIIEYVYNSTTKNITRASNSAGSATLGSPQDLTDANATALQFTYYRQDCDNNFSTPVGTGAAGCPASPGGNAGTLAAIQRVSISITVQSKKPDTEFGGQLTVTMTSNADLRNRGLPS